MSKYIIGIDTYDENSSAYVVSKISDQGVLEFIESNTVIDKEQFDKEVERMSELYNIEIVEPSFSRTQSKRRTYSSNISEKFKEQLKNDFIKYINEDTTLPFWGILEEFKNL